MKDSKLPISEQLTSKPDKERENEERADQMLRSHVPTSKNFDLSAKVTFVLLTAFSFPFECVVMCRKIKNSCQS